MRASELVKGKANLFDDGKQNDRQNKQLFPEESSEQEEKIFLRLSDIEGLGFKQPAVTALPQDHIREEPFAGVPASLENASVAAVNEAPRAHLAMLPGEIATGIARQEEMVELKHDDRDISRIYLAAKQYMAVVRRRVKAGESFPLEQALVFVNNIVNSSEDMTSRIYQLTVDYEQEDDYYLSSPVNTMVYGLKIAQRIGYEKPALIEFGLAALLHDVGMFRIPDAILNKEEKLTDEEMDLIREHPKIAVEILSEFREIYPKMIKAIYEHQERANGSGYPQGLKGEDICDYAMIIGICDSYEAMTHHRPHKKPLLQFDSIKELIGLRKNLFEPRITKAFLDEISIYPVGSYVRLNNRNVGRVIDTNKGNPMKPVIKLISDEKGKRIEPARIIDLRNYPILNIDRSVSPEDITP